MSCVLSSKYSRYLLFLRSPFLDMMLISYSSVFDGFFVKVAYFNLYILDLFWLITPNSAYCKTVRITGSDFSSLMVRVVLWIDMILQMSGWYVVWEACCQVEGEENG